MTETAKIIWGVVAGSVGTLVVTLIVAIGKCLSKSYADQVRLEANLSATTDLAVLNAVGCPCLVVSVICRGKRPVKLKGAKLRLERVDLIGKFQDAFQSTLGYTPPTSMPDGRQVLKLPMFRAAGPTDQEGGVLLQRDDVCKFILPLLVPGLGLFVEAPSQDVSITVVRPDETEHEVLRGLQIQSALRGLMAAYADKDYQLKLTIPIELSVLSATLPDDWMVGKTNPEDLRFHEEELPSREEKCSAKATYNPAVGNTRPFWCLQVHLVNTGKWPLFVKSVVLKYDTEGSSKAVLIPEQLDQGNPVAPGDERYYSLRSDREHGIEDIGKLPPGSIAVLINTPEKELLRIPGEEIASIKSEYDPAVGPDDIVELEPGRDHDSS